MKLPASLLASAALALPLLAQTLVAAEKQPSGDPPPPAPTVQGAKGEAPGPWLLGTIGVGKGADAKTPRETALKGLAIKVGPNGEAAVAYDLDLCRMVGAWTGKFTTPMNLMSRGEYPTALGEVAFTTGAVPGFQIEAIPGAAGAVPPAGSGVGSSGSAVADAGNAVAGVRNAVGAAGNGVAGSGNGVGAAGNAVGGAGSGVAPAGNGVGGAGNAVAPAGNGFGARSGEAPVNQKTAPAAQRAASVTPATPPVNQSGTPATPETAAGGWRDPRPEPFGPLPPGHARFKGFTVNGDKTILKWDIAGTEVLEMPAGGRTADGLTIQRKFRIGPSTKELVIAITRVEPGTRFIGGHKQFSVVESKSGRVLQEGLWGGLPLEFCGTGRAATDDLIRNLEATDPARARELRDILEVETRKADRSNNSRLEERDRMVWLRIPASERPLDGVLFLQTAQAEPGDPASEKPATADAATDQPESGPTDALKLLNTSVSEFMRAGPARWPEPVITQGEVYQSPITDHQSPSPTAAYVVDTIKLPDPNPWGAPMFTSGFDFFEVGSGNAERGTNAATSAVPPPTSDFRPDAAVCTFHGDVFLVSGIDEKLEQVTWRRFASGLYHPLGLKIVKGEIFVACRDGLWRLNDLNKDGECDYYELFNGDLKVTKNFHEFVFDLQTDPAGNFYFAKAGPVKNGGRGFDEIMSQHGTLMRVSPDGAKLDVIATGFRAPNGIGVGPNGELTSGDNEGTWTPACKINWIQPGGFYGVVDLAHRDPPPTDYDRPLCWLPKRVDNSGGGQVWAPEGERWGPWGGKMLHLSYGQSALYGVLMEKVGTRNVERGTATTAASSAFPLPPSEFVQGGVVKFPLQFQSGIMRARFNPRDGQLYVMGLRGWQTNGLKNGCFQRVRFTGAVPRMPIEMHVKKGGIELRFACSLDTQTAADPQNWNIEQWRYVWSAVYGSPELSTEGDAAKPGEVGKDGRAEFSKAQAAEKKHDPVPVKSVTIGTDDRTVFLEIPGLKPVMQMAIRYDLKTADGQELRGEVVNTIHALGAE